MIINNRHIILLYILSLISKYVCEKNEGITHFVMKSFSETNEELETYDLTFNYITNKFDECEDLFYMYDFFNN